MMLLSRRILSTKGLVLSLRSLSTATTTTQAAVCTELGRPLVYQDWPIASPKKNQLKIEVVAAGINFADVLQVQGLYQEKMTPPFVSGMECVGKCVRVCELTHCQQAIMSQMYNIRHT